MRYQNKILISHFTYLKFCCRGDVWTFYIKVIVIKYKNNHKKSIYKNDKKLTYNKENELKIGRERSKMGSLLKKIKKI